MLGLHKIPKLIKRAVFKIIQLKKRKRKEILLLPLNQETHSKLTSSSKNHIYNFQTSEITAKTVFKRRIGLAIDIQSNFDQS